MIIQYLRHDHGVYPLHSPSGKADLLTELNSDSLGQFDRILGRIRRIEGLRSTETSTLLLTLKA